MPHRPALALFLLGFLTLFLELVLIRYLGGNIWNLGYFPNLVLLAVFLGMGVGFVLHHHVSPRLSNWLFAAAPLLLLGLVAVLSLARPVVPGFAPWGGEIGGEVYFTATPNAEASELWFALWFLGIVAVFLCISQRTAKVFRGFAPLRAYTLDIGGSCAGIVAFILCSLLRMPAWTWFIVAAFIALAATWAMGWRRLQLLLLAVFAVIALLAWRQDRELMSNPEFNRPFYVEWSPYQKVEYVDDPETGQQIYVNGVSHQRMFDRAALRSMFYEVPHQKRRERGLPPYRKVLVIGAGSGNDVAAALANGAEHVDAVEIDPVIAELGKRFHPARPYDDPRVDLIINDARAVMTRSPGGYDLVIFALTDSLVKVSSMAQLRLENYLFTQESFARAASLLNDQGDVLIYNYYRRNWLISKLVKILHRATGQWPEQLFKEYDFAMFRAGRRAYPGVDQRSVGDEALAYVADEDVPADDWPFPYLRFRHIPALYMNALIGLAAVLMALFGALQFAERRRRGPRRIRLNLAFLGMGVAFLLLETKSIVQLSLLFGTTWLNTSLVFLAILASVLAANWSAQALGGRRALPVVFVLLIASCLLPLFLPLRSLLVVDNEALRFLAAAAMTFSPIYFANLMFSIAFREQKVPEHVFGWNLLGATLGGLLEYTSMSVGYNALAVTVAVVYSAVFMLLLLSPAAAGPPAPD